MKNIEVLSPVLPSLHFDQTKMFYESLLGSAECFRTAEYMILNFSQTNIELHFYSTKNPRDGEIAGVYLRVREIDTYHTRAQSSQGRLIKSLKKEPWGQKEFCILDPSGCLLRFGEPCLSYT